jgi:glycosyltransferase involved in cell wall biosynthesis
MPKVSIVIPYYNHGKYIDETVASIDQIPDKDLYEVIIVNDGSTDDYSNERLRALEQTGKYTIIWQENSGVGAARNNGIKHAKGEFILPVDSDNTILPDYIYRALEIFQNQPEISIVYCDRNLFGETSGICKVGPFNLQRLMLDNFIDNCAVFRKSMIDEIGGYDTFRELAGLADWELWIRAARNGHKFYYIDEPLFNYRLVPDSMIRQLVSNKTKGNTNIDHLAEKYKDFLSPFYIDEYFIKRFKKSPIGFSGKIILKIYFPSIFNRLVSKGKLRKYI